MSGRQTVVVPSADIGIEVNIRMGPANTLYISGAHVKSGSPGSCDHIPGVEAPGGASADILIESVTYKQIQEMSAVICEGEWLSCIDGSVRKNPVRFR